MATFRSFKILTTKNNVAIAPKIETKTNKKCGLANGNITVSKCKKLMYKKWFVALVDQSNPSIAASVKLKASPKAGSLLR